MLNVHAWDIWAVGIHLARYSKKKCLIVFVIVDAVVVVVAQSIATQHARHGLDQASLAIS